MVKRLIVMCMMVFLMTPFVSGQLWKMKRYEATAALGTSQFYGDIGGFTIGENALGFKDITFIQTRFSINTSARYFFTDNIAGRLSFTFAMIHADDVRGSNNDGRLYETSSLIYEPALLGEYYFVRNRERNSFLFQTYRYRRNNRLSDFLRSIDVYALTGIGGAGYNVFYGNDRIQERWDSDPTLKTRGFTAVLPLGIGAKLAFDPNLLLGVEFAARYALSDYLDGYTSQFSRRNDAYHTFSVTVNYRIRTATNGLPSLRFRRQ
ncbi:MAG: outer membrane beta-barrel protein [Bacteroidales bacterium]|nr:MAG: hypothetical protein EP313_00275 [Bacteroidota bacterium]